MLAADIDISVWDVIVYIVAGLIIGVIARALVPGRQSMSVWMTILVGVVAALIGGLVWEAIFQNNDGIAWIGSIIVGIVLVWLYATMVGRGRTTRVG